MAISYDLLIEMNTYEATSLSWGLLILAITGMIHTYGHI